MGTVKAFARRAAQALPESLKQELKNACGTPSVESVLSRMKRNGFGPKAVIDVGAYVGEWTEAVKTIFPDAKVLMVEPQPHVQSKLQATAAGLKDVSVKQSVLGAVDGQVVDFYQRETASSVLPETEKNEVASLQLKTTTLDSITHGTVFAQADFLKLDVQGFELEVLKGGPRTLAAAEAVLTETNLIEVYEGAPLFAETVAFMADHGFRLYDVGTFFRRPLDDALWQMDVMFVSQDSSLVSSRRWE